MTLTVFRLRRQSGVGRIIVLITILAVVSAALSIGIHEAFAYGAPLATMPYCLGIPLAHVIFIKVVQSAVLRTRKASQWTSLVFFAAYLGFLIVLYGLNFAEIGLKDGAANVDDTHQFGTALFFSVITWTTVGYGDVIAVKPVARFFAGVEALNGYFVMALFIAALVPIFQNLLQSSGKDGTKS